MVIITTCVGDNLVGWIMENQEGKGHRRHQSLNLIQRETINYYHIWTEFLK